MPGGERLSRRIRGNAPARLALLRALIRWFDGNDGYSRPSLSARARGDGRVSRRYDRRVPEHRTLSRFLVPCREWPEAARGQLPSLSRPSCSGLHTSGSVSRRSVRSVLSVPGLLFRPWQSRRIPDRSGLGLGAMMTASARQAASPFCGECPLSANVRIPRAVVGVPTSAEDAPPGHDCELPLRG
jgi:hypothetical protein